MELENIRPGIMVHAKGPGKMGGAVGVHVGTVDHLEGDYIKLTRKDSDDERHHWIPLSWVDRVDDKAVYLEKTKEEFESDRLDEFPEPMNRQAI